GLDMKNGILLVEYIQQLRAEGMELREALLLAGQTRLRPILMTSLAAILGLFPLALGIGPGAQMQQPLAIMVMGGLTANMLFTRMLIRAGYLKPWFVLGLVLTMLLAAVIGAAWAGLITPLLGAIGGCVVLVGLVVMMIAGHQRQWQAAY